MNGLLFSMQVAVLWVAVAVSMSGSLLLGMLAPGALEELLAGKMEGETLTEAWTFVFAMMVVIPLVMAGVSLLVGDRTNRYANFVAGLAFGLFGAWAVASEVSGGHFDGHVVMAATAAILALLIAGLGVVGLRQPSSPET